MNPEPSPRPHGGLAKPGIFRKGSRMAAALAGLTLSAGVLAACGQAASTASTTASPTYGGTANIAIVGDPPTLDWTYSTSTITHEVSWNIFEQLFSFDRNYHIKPMLATGYSVSHNGLVYTIPLRTHVKFQNGQPMTSADVVASINRWGQISNPGKQAFAAISRVVAEGPYKIQIDLSHRYAPLISDLASLDQACVILPASIANAAGTNPLSDSQIIGTGPYKLVKWVRGQVITLAAWKGYRPLPKADNWGGLAGHKVAYIKTLNYDIVPSAAVRFSGLLTGQYTVSTELTSDLYSQIKSNPTIRPVLIQPADALYFVLNGVRSPFNNVKMREAINLLINKKQIAAAAFGNKKFWSLSPGMFFPQQTSLYTTVGKSVYNSYNPAKAKQLMQQAGYNFNRPLRILVTKTYPYMYYGGVVLAQELNSIGVKTDVQVYDWPTDLAQRKNPNLWDIFVTSFSAEFDPTQLLWISPSFSGAAKSPQMQAALASWDAATTSAQRQAALSQIQKVQYQQLSSVKVANQILLDGANKKLQNFHSYIDVVMWNTWLSKA